MRSFTPIIKLPLFRRGEEQTGGGANHFVFCGCRRCLLKVHTKQREMRWQRGQRTRGSQSFSKRISSATQKRGTKARQSSKTSQLRCREHAAPPGRCYQRCSFLFQMMSFGYPPSREVRYLTKRAFVSPDLAFVWLILPPNSSLRLTSIVLVGPRSIRHRRVAETEESDLWMGIQIPSTKRRKTIRFVSGRSEFVYHNYIQVLF